MMGYMKTQEKKLTVINSNETKAFWDKKEINHHKTPTDKEIRKIRANPISSYLDIVRLTNLYDETRKDLLKVQKLSSIHYQHCSDTMRMYWEANECLEKKDKEIDGLTVLLNETKEKVATADKSREFMCGEAGKHTHIKNIILDYINTSSIIHTYDSVTKKNDTIVKFSKIEFDKFIDSLEEDEDYS